MGACNELCSQNSEHTSVCKSCILGKSEGEGEEEEWEVSLALIWLSLALPGSPCSPCFLSLSLSLSLFSTGRAEALVLHSQCLYNSFYVCNPSAVLPSALFSLHG